MRKSVLAGCIKVKDQLASSFVSELVWICAAL